MSRLRNHQCSQSLERERLELSDRLYELIVAHWASTLEDPFDWAEYPLAYYTLSEPFLQVLADMRWVGLNQVARVCAMIACGLAGECEELDLQPAPRVSAGDGPGGAGASPAADTRLWWCVLRPATGCSARVGYWLHPDGRIEFDSLELGL